MKRFLSLSAIILTLVLMTGCRSANIYNAVDVPIESKRNVSDDKIFKAIKTAGKTRGWTIKKIKPGVAKARINVRGKHTAIVKITYDKDKFSIEYQNSENLKYDAEKNTIHKYYNNWVINLERAIQFEIDTME